MPTELPKDIIKLTVALLMHQAENILGKDAIGIAGKTLIHVGGEKRKGKLIDAAIRADEYFREKCEDKDVRDAFTLTVGDLPSIQAVLKELPKTLDQESAFKTIRDNLARDFPNLTKEQVGYSARLYLDCLNRALLPLQDFTIPIIGNAVLDSKEEIKEIKADLRELLKRISSPQPKVFQPETFMNLETLPEPKGLPPGSRLPFYRNAVFTGRKDDLKALAKALLSDHRPGALAITQTIAGMGGIGKTQLAVEFCYRYGRFFNAVHWMDGSVPDHIPAEIAACGEKMNLENWPQTTLEQLRMTLNTWQAERMRLLILDNLEDPEALRQYQPDFEGMRVLVTSRNQTWDADIASMHVVNTLSRDEGVALLRKLAPRLQALPDSEVDLVASRLGYLPLALDLAGRYLQVYKITPKQYLENLHESSLKHKSLKATKGRNPTKHDADVEATFLVGWDRLEETTDGLARNFFIASGYLAPNVPIPRDVFLHLAIPQADWDIAKDDEGDVDVSKIDLSKYSDIVDDAILRLQQLGLLTETLALHPLLSEFARAQTWGDEILKSLAERMVALSTRAGETSLPATFAPLRPHIEIFAPAAENNKLDDAGVLWNNYGFYLKRIADYDAARSAFERALDIDASVLGPDHPNVAIHVNNLGLVLQEQGDFNSARMAFERALEVTEAVFGPNHPSVAIRVNNLGSVLHDLGDFNGARAAYERALKIDEAAFGPDHTNVAMRLNNLGNLKRVQGDLEGALADIQRALKIDESALGLNHPNVAIRLCNLCKVLQMKGDLEDARAAIERALKIDEANFGPDGHPNLAIRFNNLGNV